jgi:hypothetical protein
VSLLVCPSFAREWQHAGLEENVTADRLGGPAEADDGRDEDEDGDEVIVFQPTFARGTAPGMGAGAEDQQGACKGRRRSSWVERQRLFGVRGVWKTGSRCC